MRITLRTLALTGALTCGGFLGMGTDPAQAQGPNGQFGQRGQFAARLNQARANGNFGQGQAGQNLGQGQAGQNLAQGQAGRTLGQGQAGRTLGQAGGSGSNGQGGTSRLGPAYNPAQPYSYQQQMSFRKGVIAQYSGKTPQGNMSADQQKAFQAGRQYVQTQRRVPSR